MQTDHSRSRLRLGDPGPVLSLAQRALHRGAVRDRLPHRPARWPSSQSSRRRSATGSAGCGSSTSSPRTCSSSTSCSASTGGSSGNQLRELEELHPAQPERQQQWKEIKRRARRWTSCRREQRADRNHRPQRPGRLHLLPDVPGVPVPVRDRLRPLRRDEQVLAAAAVRVDRAADGRRLRGAPVASRVHVVLHPLRDRSTFTSCSTTTTWKAAARSPRWAAAGSSSSVRPTE